VLGLNAALGSSSSDRRQRSRMREIDNLIQTKVCSVHRHFATSGDIASLLEVPLDDNRIAAVLGHEISHCILRHGQEQIGESLLGELVRCVPRRPPHQACHVACSVSFLSMLQPVLGWTNNIWATALMEYLGYNASSKAADVLVSLPYSRVHE
jgi:hypothetical protein